VTVVLLALAALLALGDDRVDASVPAAATISAGGHNTCAVTTAGGVKCWGNNEFGQLGDGTTTNRTDPVDVSGLTSGVAAVSVGPIRACAVTTARTVKCWGDDATTPVDVSGLTSGVAAISVGGAHICALTTAGGVKCWGFNSDGQLGDGTRTDRTSPADVLGLTSGVAAVSVGTDGPGGSHHTCALTTAGGVKCWGKNSSGQLGATTEELCAEGGEHCSSIPLDVSGLTSGAAAVAAGDHHTCALTTAGGVKCWGANWDRQLGDGTTTDSTTPVDVSGLTSGVAAAAAGSYHTCAVTTAGGVKCWGSNRFGELGDGTTTDRTTPVDVVGFGAEPAPTPTVPSQLPPGGGMPPTSDARTDGWWAPPLGGMALVTLALAAGAWHARRRWLG
jgi:alpha-tubulin suppressor-like RCC1 family protein